MESSPRMDSTAKPDELRRSLSSILGADRIGNAVETLAFGRRAEDFGRGGQPRCVHTHLGPLGNRRAPAFRRLVDCHRRSYGHSTPRAFLPASGLLSPAEERPGAAELPLLLQLREGSSGAWIRFVTGGNAILLKVEILPSPRGMTGLRIRITGPKDPAGSSRAPPLNHPRRRTGWDCVIGTSNPHLR